MVGRDSLPDHVLTVGAALTAGVVVTAGGVTGQKHTFPPPWESTGYVLETY